VVLAVCGGVVFVETVVIELSKGRGDVGVIGLVGWLVLSEWADDSFVRFFFRKPSVCFICRR
jgi:hypothetical protein